VTHSNDISTRLRNLGDLKTILDDLNVKWVTIAPNGHWSYEKLGRTRHGSAPLDSTMLRSIAEEIPPGRHIRSGEWALRKYDGVQGAAILIERLPVAVADRLPQQVLAALKRQVRQDGNGVLVGQPGAGKGALLLWLALQIPDEPVLYVAENPPSEFPGNHIMHVYPPSTPQQRRALERFVRLTPTVMWDRVANTEDLLTLFGFPGARRRWFTLDSSSVRSALRMLTAATQNGCDTRFSTMLSLTSSVIGRPEARNMIVRDDDGWSELFCDDESCLPTMAAYETSDIRRLGPTEVSVPGIPLDEMPPPEVDVTSHTADTEDELQEVTDADLDTPDVSDPHTVPVDVDAALSEVSEISEAEDVDPDDAVTGMLPREEVRELREQQMRKAGDGEGEMLQSIKEATAERAVPEVTKHYVDMPEELAGRVSGDDAVHAKGDEQAAYLNSIVPGLDLDEESAPDAVPAVNIDDLRITTIETVNEEDLEVIDDVEEPDSYDGLADDSDYSGVFDGELDFDSLAEEMLSEISEVEVADPESAAAFAATNPEHQILLSEHDIESVEDDFDEAPTRTASSEVVAIAARRAAEQAEQTKDEEDDSTTEFTLDKKLLALRRQRKNDD
jgi:hypothetical protein